VGRKEKQDHFRKGGQAFPRNDAVGGSEEGEERRGNKGKGGKGEGAITYHSIWMDVSSAARKRGSPGGKGRSTIEGVVGDLYFYCRGWETGNGDTMRMRRAGHCVQQCRRPVGIIMRGAGGKRDCGG
jgi:hypothetical protein